MSTPTSPPSPPSTSASLPGQPISRVGLIQIVGFLVCVEIASGAIQGYYTPIFSDIARHLQIHDADLNWFEAAQLMVAALIVPVLSRLGDLVGHRTVLLWSTVLTAAATWGVAFAPTFWTFLVAWALAGSMSCGCPSRWRSSTAAPTGTPPAPASPPGSSSSRWSSR
ncbi:MFS transporter [Janibacter sp. GXQ6167]|uniref:MFS transporter n=1 Tax=Janibacter sp. GXQ6167 TaxID=3240791 RepID=UPI003525DFEE